MTCRIMATVMTLYGKYNVTNLAVSCPNQYFNHISPKVDIYLKHKQTNKQQQKACIHKGWRICNNCSSFAVSFAIRLQP